MPYEGKQLQPRELADYCADLWEGGELLKAVATTLAESNGYIGAYNDNFREGELVSRDCGIFQINIPASRIGTPEEKRLRSDALYNAARARDLYDAPWTRNGIKDIRRWQPWVAYTTGWAMFPEWWVWTSTEPRHWAATGRYLHKSVRGLGNYYAGLYRLPTPFLDYRVVPPKPSVPPIDGVGPRPVKNNGL